jgi:GT2 family glycosyltransferase/tetratricopeptide (TPR) repeat protein
MMLSPRVLRRLLPAREHGDAQGSDSSQTPIDVLIRRADALRDQRDTAGAAAAYAEALVLDPNRTDLLVQRGNMLKDSGRFAEAEVAYRMVLLAQPGDADAQLQLGHALKLQGRRNAALAAYSRSAELDPASPAASVELAAMGEPSRQAAAFDAQLRAGGTDALVAMSQTLLAMRSQLDEMIAALPDAAASAAYPVDLYGVLRECFDIPPPPPDQSPHVTIVVMADPAPTDILHEQLAAYQAQSWPARSLIVVGHSDAARGIVARAAAANAEITWLETRASSTHQQAEAHGALAARDGWIVLLAAGAVLHPHALGWVAAASRLGPARAFVWDEEQGTPRPGGMTRSNPILRQAVDHDTLLEANVYGGSIAVWRDDYAAAGSSGAPCRGALLLDLAHAGKAGHIPWPLTWSRIGPAVPNRTEHEAAVSAHTARHGILARVEGPGVLPGSVRIAWPSRAEAVHVIIPTRDNACDVEAFVATLRATAARPEELAITVIDNGGRDLAMRQRLQDLAASGAIALDTVAEPFNWSRLNNAAARMSTAPVLVFANDDMLMTTPGWDDRIRGLLQRSKIGAVGARLTYGDETMQHAGVLLGWRGSAIHDGLYAPIDSAGPAGRWQVTRAVSAVTGAFLATRRDIFMAVGGFDEVGLPVSYSDVDYCMKIRADGQRVLWTPYITLVHHESKTRGLDHTDPIRQAHNDAERAVLEARWNGWLDSDPGVNPAWHDATLPFRLLSWPSTERVQAHVARCSQVDPWQVGPPHGSVKNLGQVACRR